MPRSIDEKRLRAAYGLPDSVPIRHQLPAPEELAAEKSFLRRLPEALGCQPWMMKTWRGRVLALILVSATVKGVIDLYEPVRAGVELVASYARGLELPSIQFEPRMVRFDPSLDAQGQHRDPLYFAPGTILTNAYRYPETAIIDRFTVYALDDPDHIGVNIVRNPNVRTRWGGTGATLQLTSTGVMQALMELTPLGFDHALRYLTLETIELPPGIQPERLDRNRLPIGWDTTEFNAVAQELGDAWVKERRSLALAVPSSVDPRAEIILINPYHPDYAKVRVIDSVEVKTLSKQLQMPA